MIVRGKEEEGKDIKRKDRGGEGRENDKDEEGGGEERNYRKGWKGRG